MADRADKALVSKNGNLGPNWDLNLLLQRASDEYIKNGVMAFHKLTIIKRCTGWYLQDGNHRALGYALLLLRDAIDYCEIEVFAAE